MKKSVALILTALMTMFLLTGCFASDTNIKLGYTDKITLEAQYLFDNAVLEESAGEGEEAVNVLDEMIGEFKRMDKEDYPDDNEAAEFAKLENQGEKGDKSGFTAKISYKNWEQLMESEFFAMLVGTGAPTSTDLADDKSGLKYECETSPFGKTYSVKGNIDLTQSGYEDLYVTYKLSAPLLMSSSNALKKTGVGTTHVWEVTADKALDVNFKAFIPNIAVLIESIIILLLAIALVLVIVLKNKKPAEEIAEEIDGQLSMDGEFFDEEAENFFEESAEESAEEQEEEFVSEIEEETTEEANEDTTDNQ